MTDLDTVIRAAKLMDCHKVIQVKKDTRGGKQLYRTTLYGRKAIEIMKEIYELMGDRRKIKIDECIQALETKNRRLYPDRKPYSRGAIIAWQKEEEAA